MKKGIEYALSGEKRVFDLTVATAMLPVYWVAHGTVAHLLKTSGVIDPDPIFRQKRIGRGQEPFMIEKFRTLDEDDGNSYGRWADTLRRLCVDELAQRTNILNGEMSITGWRPLIPEDYQLMMDQLPPKLRAGWLGVTMATRPGELSSYGIACHSDPTIDQREPEQRAELDIKDLTDSCLKRDLHLVGTLLGRAATNRLG